MHTKRNIIAALLTSATALATGTASAQFERTYGTTEDERLEWIEQTNEGNYIMAGVRQVMDADTGAFASVNSYVIHADGSGNVLFDVEVGSTAGFEVGYRVLEVSDGFVVAGETSGGPAGMGLYLFKLDLSGSLVWSQAYPGTAFAGGSAGQTGLAQTADGGFLISGRNQGGPADQTGILIRTNSTGAPVFIKEYIDPRLGQQAFVSFSDVHELDDGRIVISGYTSVTPFPGERDTLLLITDAAGVPIRANTYGQRNFTDWAREVEPAANGDFILTGFAKAAGEGGGTFLMRVDSNCNLLWYNTFREFSVDTSLIEEASGNIILGGTTNFNTDDGPAALQTDANGNPLTSFKYGATQGSEFGDHLIPTQDGGYAFAAWTNGYGFGNFDTYLLDLDAGFKTGCEQDWVPSMVQIQPEPLEIELDFVDRTDWGDVPSFVFAPQCRTTDPCDVEPTPTDKCHVPWDKTFCRNRNSVDVKVTICNCDDVPHSYDLSFAGLTGANACAGVDGPTAFTVLDPMPALVGPGDCQEICVRVFRPASMVPLGLLGCYDVTFNNLDTGTSVTCTGSVISGRRWCPIVIGGPVIGVPVTPAPIDFGWELVNEGDDISPDTPFQVVVMRSDMLPGPNPFSINGLPPGSPVTGILAPTEPGGSQTLDLVVLPDPGPTPDVFFDIFYDVILMVDDDGDGTFDPIGSQSLRLIPDATCACDIDGQAGVDVQDLLTFLADWFATSGPVTELLDFLSCWFPASNGSDCP